MILNVYNSQTEKVVKIDSSKFDSKKHSHRNSHREFTKEELTSFGVKTK